MSEVCWNNSKTKAWCFKRKQCEELIFFLLLEREPSSPISSMRWAFKSFLHRTASKLNWNKRKGDRKRSSWQAWSYSIHPWRVDQAQPRQQKQSLSWAKRQTAQAEANAYHSLFLPPQRQSEELTVVVYKKKALRLPILRLWDWKVTYITLGGCQQSYGYPMQPSFRPNLSPLAGPHCRRASDTSPNTHSCAPSFSFLAIAQSLEWCFVLCLVPGMCVF